MTGDEAPPALFNPDAEVGLLGAVMSDPRVLEAAADRLKPEDFGLALHGRIWSSLLHEASSGRPANPVTIRGQFEADPDIPRVGGITYLMSLLTAPAAQLMAPRELLTEVMGLSDRRRMRQGLEAAVAACADISIPVPEVAALADQAVLAREETSIVETDAADAMRAALADLEGGISGVTSQRIESVDDLLGPLEPKSMTIVAARPGMGKTSLALCFIEHAALRAGKTCAIFSLEMSELQVVQRLISMNAEIDGNRIRRGRLSLPELQAISDASGRLQQAQIFVEESTRLTVTDILAKSRRLQAERGRLDLIVIDYLQLIEGAEGDDDNRVQEVAKISRALKAIAREIEVPVVAVSQLSRQIETRGTEPMLSDLRESGSLEADADLVMFLWQKDQQDRKDCVVRLKLAKQRNGPTADIDLHFEAELTRFRDLGEMREGG